MTVPSPRKGHQVDVSEYAPNGRLNLQEAVSVAARNLDFGRHMPEIEPPTKGGAREVPGVVSRECFGRASVGFHGPIAKRQHPLYCAQHHDRTNRA